MNTVPALIDITESSALATETITRGHRRGAHLAAAIAVALTLPAATALADDQQEELQSAAVRRRAPGPAAGRFAFKEGSE